MTRALLKGLVGSSGGPVSSASVQIDDLAPVLRLASALPFQQS
jgi:hypothetical protein